MRTRVLALFVVLCACSVSQGDLPTDVMDREKFRDVLLEATLIEARINHELIVDHQTMVPTVQYYDDLFKEKGITKEQFSKSFDHYAARPVEMKAVYEDILTELGRRKDQQPN